MLTATPHHIVLVWVGLMGVAVPVRAQKPIPSSATWAMSLQLGTPISTPTSSIRMLMEDNGLGGSAGFSGTSYPMTKGLPGLGLRVELLRSRSSIGGDLHIIDGNVEGRENTYVQWRAISLAPLYSYYSRLRTTRISVGPSVQWIQIEAGERISNLFQAPPPSALQKRLVPGFVIDAAVRFPARTSFFAELGGRYEAAFGQVHNELSYTNGSTGTKRMLPFDVGFNRFMFTIGLGFRMGSH